MFYSIRKQFILEAEPEQVGGVASGISVKRCDMESWF